jgi:hypothetical protein
MNVADEQQNMKWGVVAGFTRLFLCHDLPVEWRIGVKEILIFHQQLNHLGTV